MQTIPLETWQIHYSDEYNALLLFINNAVLFTIDPSNVTSFLETMSKPDVGELALVGQPMLPQELETYEPEEDDFTEDIETLEYFNYRIEDANLVEQYNGKLEGYIITFTEDLDRRMLEADIWSNPALNYMVG